MEGVAVFIQNLLARSATLPDLNSRPEQPGQTRRGSARGEQQRKCCAASRGPLSHTAQKA